MKQNKGLSSQKIAIVIAVIGILFTISYIAKVFHINNNKDIEIVTQEHKEVVQGKEEDKEESKEEKIDRLSKTWAEIRNNKEVDVMDEVIDYAVSYDDHAETELYRVKQDQTRAKWTEDVDVLEETLASYEDFITKYKDRLLQGVAKYIEKHKENNNNSDIDISYFEMFYEKHKNK